MKPRYIFFLTIILASGIVISRNKTTPVAITDVGTTPVDNKKQLISEIKAPPRVEVAKDLKEITGHSQKEETTKEIALRAEKRFLAMVIPSSFSEDKNTELYNLYGYTSDYLNSVAVSLNHPELDGIDINKENLLKAFKSLLLYYKEEGFKEQTDSALFFIQQDRPHVFEDAFNELSKKDQKDIKYLIRMQSN